MGGVILHHRTVLNERSTPCRTTHIAWSGFVAAAQAKRSTLGE